MPVEAPYFAQVEAGEPKPHEWLSLFIGNPAKRTASTDLTSDALYATFGLHVSIEKSYSFQFHGLAWQLFPRVCVRLVALASRLVVAPEKLSVIIAEYA